MRYRSLGSTGMSVSEIGFGTWGIGSDKGLGLSYGPQDDRTSIDALEKAFQMGITYYDTADLYGGGHSERLLGMAFSNRRDKVTLATKVGFLNAHEQDFSLHRVKEALHNSLRRLKTDYVDVYQLHNPTLKVLKNASELFDFMYDCRRKGIIRATGISARSPDEALRIVDDYPIDCVQVNLNLTDMRAITNGLLEKCSQHNVGVVIRSPLALGFLSGKISEETHFHVKDHRNRFSKQQMSRWSRANLLYKSILNDLPETTDAQNALRFCLSHSAVGTVIPGMHTVSEVMENQKVASLPLYSMNQIDRMLKIYSQHTFYVAGISAGSTKQ